MKKKTLLIKTADLCIRIHYKYPYIEQQCETWRVNEGYEPDILNITLNGVNFIQMKKLKRNTRGIVQKA